MIASHESPIMARIGFALLFGGCCWANAITALAPPRSPTDFADYAVFKHYRRFIEGPVEQIATPVTLVIAAIQGFIALSMTLAGRPFRVGSLLGLLFCIAILPQGFGAAFPATVFTAIGFYWLYRQSTDCAYVKRTNVTSRPAYRPTYRGAVTQAQWTTDRSFAHQLAKRPSEPKTTFRLNKPSTDEIAPSSY